MTVIPATNDLIVQEFILRGSIMPLLKGAVADAGLADIHVPTRRLGGWMMTYGRLGPDGGIVPTVDREKQVMEAARELGHIDWSNYMRPHFNEQAGEWYGHWNDTHDNQRLIGVPQTLEFHDGSTRLSKAHGKVGFWTTGHLWDRADPESWTRYTDYVPTEEDLAKADDFWTLANLLDGFPRPLGLSAHGYMALSPCKKRVLAAQVNACAVAQVPINPDATAEMLKGSPLEFLRRGMIGEHAPSQCGRCRCPEGACQLLRKAARAHGQGEEAQGDLSSAKQLNAKQLEDADAAFFLAETAEERLSVLVRRVARKFRITEQQALEWVKYYFLRSKKESSDGQRAA